MSAKSSALPLADASPVADLQSNSQWLTVSCIVITDLITLSLAFGLAVFGRHLVTPAYGFHWYWDVPPLVLMMMGAFAIQGLYPGVLLHPAEEMRRIFIASTAVFLVLASATFLSRSSEAYSRSLFLLTWTAGPPLVLLARHALRSALSRYSWWGVPAIVLGTGSAAKRVLRTLRSRTRGVRVVGVLSTESLESWPSDLPPLLGPMHLAPEISRSRVAQYVIVAMPDKSNVDLRHIIQDFCHGFSHVLLIPDMLGLCSLGVAARDLSGEVGLELPQRLFHRNAFLVKRVLDVLLSAVGIAILLPVFALLALLVRLTSKGPIFFCHKRCGRNGRTFKAWKFRTMVPNADVLLADYLATHPEELFEWQRDQKLRNDPRTTVVGKWLRRLSLDELPQLFNVLAGHMSLVGPRPIVKAEIAKYGRGYFLYQRVLPGITGLWQVSGRNDTTYEQRVAYDEFYADNWSVWLDIYILIRTIRVVLTASGAY